MNQGNIDSVSLNTVAQDYRWKPDGSFDFLLDDVNPPSLSISNSYSQYLMGPNMGIDEQNQSFNSASWDTSPFLIPFPQLNPFEIPTAPEDVNPDTGPIMTRRRRAILHRQSALIEPGSSTAAAQVSFSSSTWHISFTYHVHYLLYFSYVYLF
jgi:hypothetical protein